jgi:GMP synthase-like glutamine amidotransferase
MDDNDKKKNLDKEHFLNIFKIIDSSIEVIFKLFSDLNLVKFIISKEQRIDAFILSGSSYRILEDSSPQLPKRILSLGIPILGLCYGFEWIVQVLGGTVATFENKKEHIYNKFIEIEKPFKVSKIKYAFNHYDYIQKLPKNWSISLTHKEGIDEQIWIAYDNNKQIMGLQFHPEKYKKSGVEFYRCWLSWLKIN